jgi:FAD synthase
VVRRLRNIRNFKTPEALRYQISLDITKARAILKHT